MFPTSTKYQTMSFVDDSQDWNLIEILHYLLQQTMAGESEIYATKLSRQCSGGRAAKSKWDRIFILEPESGLPQDSLQPASIHYEVGEVQ